MQKDERGGVEVDKLCWLQAGSNLVTLLPRGGARMQPSESHFYEHVQCKRSFVLSLFLCARECVRVRAWVCMRISARTAVFFMCLITSNFVYFWLIVGTNFCFNLNRTQS